MAVKVHLILEISWDRDYWHCHRITIRPASKMVKKSEKPRGQAEIIGPNGKWQLG